MRNAGKPILQVKLTRTKDVSREARFKLQICDAGSTDGQFNRTYFTLEQINELSRIKGYEGRYSGKSFVFKWLNVNAAHARSIVHNVSSILNAMIIKNGERLTEVIDLDLTTEEELQSIVDKVIGGK